MGAAAYLRAAIAYADLTQPQVSAALNVSASTINRWLTGPSHTGYKAPSAEQIQHLEQLTGVPPGFLQNGFEGMPASSTDQRVDELTERLKVLETNVPENLEKIATTLQRLQPAETAPQNIDETLVDRLHTLAREVEVLINQQGRHIGKRDPQRRAEKGQHHRAPRDAA